jgi:hypothetical protein
MRKPFYFLALFLFQSITNSLYAQGFNWANGSFVNGEGEAYSVAIDKSGNSYEVVSVDTFNGSSTGALVTTFGPLTVNDSFRTGQQGILVSVDSAGNYRWAVGTQHGRAGFLKIVSDAHNNLYIIGCATQNFTFGTKSFSVGTGNTYLLHKS